MKALVERRILAPADLRYLVSFPRYGRLKLEFVFDQILLCRNWSGRKINFKRPYLGNEKRYRRSAGAKILVFSRAFIPSFMKVAWRHSFTLFRPLSVKETTFSRCSRGHSWALSGQNMPPGTFSMREKNLLGAPYFGMPCKIYELFRLVSFTQNYGGYAYIRITSTMFKSAWFWIKTMVNRYLFSFLRYRRLKLKFVLDQILLRRIWALLKGHN